MKKSEVVKSNKLFNEIIAKGKKCQNAYFVIYNKEFGIAISKKLGNAVTRNKQKRRMRELLTINKKIFSNNRDYIIIIRKAFINANYELLNKELNKLMNR